MIVISTGSLYFDNERRRCSRIASVSSVVLGMQRHEQHGLLAVHRVSAPDDRGLGDLGEPVDHGLDLTGVDVLAASDDHVLGPVDENQVAVLVEPPDVTGVQPAVDDGFRGLLGPVEIAPHDVGALDHDLTGLAVGHRVARRVDQPDRLAGQGQAHRSRLALPVQRVDRAGARRLPTARTPR